MEKNKQLNVGSNVEYTPEYLQQLLNTLKNIEEEKFKTMNLIADYGFKTYNFPLASKFIAEALHMAPNNISTILNKVQIHVKITPHDIKEDIQRAEDLIEKFCSGDKDVIIHQQAGVSCAGLKERLNYLKGLYYMSIKEWNKAYALLPAIDFETAVVKEVARGMALGELPSMEKYGFITAHIKTLVEVFNVARDFGLYDMFYRFLRKWERDRQKIEQQPITDEEKFIVHMLYSECYRERGDAQKLYEHASSAYNMKKDDENAKKVYLCSLIATKKFEKVWQIEKEINRNVVNAILTFNVPKILDSSSLEEGGKNILIVTDQGFGDNFMHLRHFRSFMDKYPKNNYAVFAYNELYNLIKKNFPDIEIFPYNAQKSDIPFVVDGYIYVSHLPIFTNPNFEEIRRLGREFEITVDNPVVYNKPAVGIFYRTTPRSVDTRHRSFELEEFAKRAEVEKLIKDGYDVYNFTIDTTPEEDKKMEEMGIINLKKDLKSFEDTARFLKNMDELRTIDTGIMHLAGAMKVPTKVYLNNFRDCKFADSNDDKQHFLYKNLQIIGKEPR